MNTNSENFDEESEFLGNNLDGKATHTHILTSTNLPLKTNYTVGTVRDGILINFLFSFLKQNRSTSYHSNSTHYSIPTSVSTFGYLNHHFI
jgi:hypothetical protein